LEGEPVTEREELARIIDPEAWGVLDGTLPPLPMDRHMSARFDAWKQSSLRKADQWLSRPSPVDGVVEALKDMREGWRYIREHHGDLYGVGWDRAEQAADAAIARAKGETQ
jgi:hypothetical protein